MKVILAITLLVAVTTALHSDLEHLQMELRTRWEGLLSGLYQDESYTLSADCFSTSSEYDDLLESVMKFAETRNPGHILSIYYQASHIIETEMAACGLQEIVLSARLANAEGRFDFIRMANVLQREKSDLAMHLFNVFTLHHEKYTILPEEEYFAKTREQFMHIGSFINGLLGERHHHNSGLLGASPDLTPLELLTQFGTGLMKGLSTDGKTLGTCYDRIVDGINDIELIGEMLSKVIHGQGGFDTYGMLFSKFYGHFNSAKNDCRVHILAMHLSDIASLKVRAVDLQSKATTVAASLGMQFMMQNYSAVGISIGQFMKEFLDFYVN